ncbi:heavy metal-associated domain protein [Clostridiaceae bacterium DONG20-135]|uniref:Heavy metal-associated domain protein n=1 Tax=Copranaerobaculum intestinale TaxID=2692629 RepID=A0A6N8U3Q4_9FIRM|nr:heavy-metal-associated domain-containing protein [Copranaerobaculum intestinale]MXQ72826.1 heavy metal-associated domain protein [Copranaerobaculum intestinale]
MAQVSITYCLSAMCSQHDVKELKRTLDEFPGVKSVAVNEEEAKLSIDYDDTGVSQKQLEKRLEECGYTFHEASKHSF